MFRLIQILYLVSNRITKFSSSMLNPHATAGHVHSTTFFQQKFHYIVIFHTMAVILQIFFKLHVNDKNEELYGFHDCFTHNAILFYHYKLIWELDKNAAPKT